MLNLDTHILIHALTGQLTIKEREVLANDQWGISAIVIWELSKLAQLGRIDLDIDSADFARALSSIHIWPLDLAVSRQIRALDFRSDPADEIIAATSLVHGAPLVTRDRRLRRSRLVPLA
jgi:PIN domain nuclease of toxin-antitoxin system